ncbi:MAG: hypothetical protein EHM23_05940 [Acidobacteria bacterium]|nr:MAG: hypothetical protein EHM23_05940 [Acidobacteriota bacterium]
MRKNYYPVFLSLILLLTGQVWGQRDITLARGTAIQIRLSEEISSEKAKTGDRFDAILDQDISDNGTLLARRGDAVVGQVVRAQNGDRDEGDMIELTLTELRSGNRTYALDTNNVIVRTKDQDDGKDHDATIVGGSAGAGAIIGAIAGGLKGAIIGAAVGAGAGAATILITGGDKVEFDPEQKFRFYLDRDVRMTAIGTASGSSQSSSTDDRYGRNQDSGYGTTNGRVPEDVRDRVSELDRQADHVWSMIQNDSSMSDALRNSSRESEDAMRLYIAISNFANSTEQLQKFAKDSRMGALRGAAESLVRQAENIDQLMRSVNTFGHLQDDWRQAQNALSRLAGDYNLAYTPGSSGTYRTE